MTFIDPDETPASGNTFRDPDKAPAYSERLKRLATATMQGVLSGGPLMGGLAGAFGESMKQTGEIVDRAAYDAGGKVTDLTGSPGLGYAANVATQAIPTILGGEAAKLASPSLQTAGRALMQSALKPPYKDLRTGNAARAIDTLLEEGINPTQGGVAALRGKIDDLSGQIEAALQGSTATVNKGEVGKRLLETAEQLKKQVNPEADLEAARKTWLGFRNHPLLAGKQDIPVQLAQELKQGTYAQLSKKYGQIGTAEEEAQKALARGLKEEISGAVPGVAGLNKAESELINALKVSERRALMEANKNLAGLALLAQNPAGFAAFMADKSALFKSIVARMLYSGSEQIPATVGRMGGAAYGAGVLSGEPAMPRGILSERR